MNKVLAASERLKHTLLAEGYWQDILQDVAIIETALKALEIIVEYEIDIPTLKESESLEDYNESVYPIGGAIDYQEQYDILKEVLL